MLEDLPRYLREEYEAARNRRWQRTWATLTVLFMTVGGISLAMAGPITLTLPLLAWATVCLMITRWNT